MRPKQYRKRKAELLAKSAKNRYYKDYEIHAEIPKWINRLQAAEAVRRKARVSITTNEYARRKLPTINPHMPKQSLWHRLNGPKMMRKIFGLQ